MILKKEQPQRRKRKGDDTKYRPIFAEKEGEFQELRRKLREAGVDSWACPLVRVVLGAFLCFFGIPGDFLDSGIVPHYHNRGRAMLEYSVSPFSVLTAAQELENDGATIGTGGGGIIITGPGAP
jgi:hypothetical protein